MVIEIKFAFFRKLTGTEDAGSLSGTETDRVI
jgi:hypothetical protein